MSVLQKLQTACKVHISFSLIAMGSLFPGMKWTGNESDHSPHLAPSLRASGAVPPLATPMFLRGLHRDSFKFQLYIRRLKKTL